MWKLWMILALILLGLEFVTVGFLLIFFSFGAFVAVLTTLITDNISIQLFVFALSSALSILFIRPFLRNYLKIDKKAPPSAVDAMIGKEGFVIKEIDKHNFGQVKVDGAVWTAKNLNDNKIEKGVNVYIVGIEGVKLVVTPSNTNN
jgi:membrane protein implicated in regulation of membrane protease activity